MKTSVLVQNVDGTPLYVTQNFGVFDDLISFTYGAGSKLCGHVNYSLISVPNPGVVPLSSTELTIDLASGLISLYTENSETIGTHSVTVSCSLVDYPAIEFEFPPFTI